MHSHLDRYLGGILPRSILKGQAPSKPSIEQQAARLDMLRQFLELAGILCEFDGMLNRIQVPLLVKAMRGTYAVGTYRIQQELPKAKHPLNALPEKQVRLFSDYELAHDLPNVAQSLLD